MAAAPRGRGSGGGKRGVRKWAEAEIGWLRQGVKKHGEGAWGAIHADPSFAFFAERSAEDLGAKWEEAKVKQREMAGEDGADMDMALVVAAMAQSGGAAK